MSIFKKILFSLIVAIDLLLLVVTIGYIKWGIEMPSSLAGRQMVFMGAYLLAMAYGILFLGITTILIIWIVRWGKNGR